MFKFRKLSPTLRVPEKIGLGRALEFIFLGSQVVLMLLVQGSHFEGHWFRTSRLFSGLQININTYEGQFSRASYKRHF